MASHDPDDQLHFMRRHHARSEDAYLADADPKASAADADRARLFQHRGPSSQKKGRRGHTHMLSSLFSGSHVVREGPGLVQALFLPDLHPGILLAGYNGNPTMKGAGCRARR